MMIPMPKTNSPKNTLKSKEKKVFTALSTGRYTPAINNTVEPEIPGKTIAEMATMPTMKT